LEQPPSWNDGAVASNPCVSWAFLSVNGALQMVPDDDDDDDDDVLSMHVTV